MVLVLGYWGDDDNRATPGPDNRCINNHALMLENELQIKGDETQGRRAAGNAIVHRSRGRAGGEKEKEHTQHTRGGFENAALDDISLSAHHAIYLRTSYCAISSRQCS